MFQTLKSLVYSSYLQSAFSSYISYRQQRNFPYFSLNSAQQQGNNAVECKQMWSESNGRKKSTYAYTVVSPGLTSTVQKYNHMVRIDSSPKPCSPLPNRQENKKLGWLGKGERTRDSKCGFFSQTRSLSHRCFCYTTCHSFPQTEKSGVVASFPKRAPFCHVWHGPMEYLLWSWRCQGAEELMLLLNWAYVSYLAQSWELNPKFPDPPEL